MAVVDEIFVELHFSWVRRTKYNRKYPDSSLGLNRTMSWGHQRHSMQQAFDLLRELRRCGVAVHAWP